MVKINCAALPGSLIEADRLGREKGAYTATTLEPRMKRLDLGRPSSQ